MVCPKCGVYVVETNPVCRNCGCRFIKDDEKNNEQNKEQQGAKESTVISSQRPRFYKTTWFMWVMLLTIYPVGLFLMWRYKKHNIVVRIAVTGILLLGVVLANTDLYDKALTRYYASMSRYYDDSSFMGLGINSKEVDDDIKFKDITMDNESNKSITRGYVINNDNKIHSFAVSVSYYDENDKLISVAKGIVVGVPPDSAKKFEAISYKVPVKFKYYKPKIDFVVQ